MNLNRVIALFFIFLGCVEAMGANGLWVISKTESTPAVQYRGALHFLKKELESDRIDINKMGESKLTREQVIILSDIRKRLSTHEDAFWKYGLEHPSALSPTESAVWTKIDSERKANRTPLNDIDFIKSRLQYNELFEAAKRQKAR